MQLSDLYTLMTMFLYLEFMILSVDLESNNSGQSKLRIAIKSQKQESSIGKEIINL